MSASNTPSRVERVVLVMEDNSTFHPPEEWEALRPLITQLYFTEDRTLKEVQKVLVEQHHFHAT
jgi:Clr5 domain